MLYGSFTHSISEREIMSLKMTDIADVIEAGRAHGEFGPQRSVSTLRKFFQYLEENGQETPFDWRDVEVPHVPRKINEYLTNRLLNSSSKCIQMCHSWISVRAVIHIGYTSICRPSR